MRTDAHMLHTSLVNPAAKLEIKDLLKSSPSPPSSPKAQPLPYARSLSVPSPHSQCNYMLSPSSASSVSYYSGSTTWPDEESQHECKHSRQLSEQSGAPSCTAQRVFQQKLNLEFAADPTRSNKRRLPMDEEPLSLPAKKSSKWSPAENEKIIKLRGKNMKWLDISNELPGRSDISCRLHYQNYLEKRSEWDEEKRNKLARVYDRLKSELWNPIANELGVPWRAAEAMHWSLGQHEMARRANVTPFAISAARVESHQPTNGRVAQRDRMLESTRIFEGQALGTLGPSFANANGNRHSHHLVPAGLPYRICPPPNVHIAPIKSEPNFDGDGEEGSEGENEEKEGQKTGKRLSDLGTRLPGLAQLDGEVQAIAQRERNSMASTDKHEGRSSWSGIGGCNSSDGSGRSGGCG